MFLKIKFHVFGISNNVGRKAVTTVSKNCSALIFKTEQVNPKVKEIQFLETSVIS